MASRRTETGSSMVCSVLDEDVDPEADADIINEPDVVAGVHIRETGAGNAAVLVANAVANGDSGNGVEIREADDGDLNAQVNTAHAEDNVVDGLLVREENGGSLASDLLNLSASAMRRTVSIFAKVVRAV